jgi:hypothetical protein
VPCTVADTVVDMVAEVATVGITITIITVITM